MPPIAELRQEQLFAMQTLMALTLGHDIFEAREKIKVKNASVPEIKPGRKRIAKEDKKTSVRSWTGRKRTGRR
jgi:hypothetical protein